jgi:hypothetical protein
VDAGPTERSESMGIPTGKIIDRPLLARACGCVCEFQLFERDRFLAQRRAAFVGSRCPECVAKSQAEHQRLAALVPAKGEALRALPPDTRVTMTRTAEARWAGTLTADERTVEGVGDSPVGLVVALARSWLAGRLHPNPVPDRG